MFVVEITPEAHDAIIERFRLGSFARPGLLIERKGQIGELTRMSDGTSKWEIERPYPLHARVIDLQPFAECLTGAPTIDGVLVWLKSVQRRVEEPGIRVCLRAGQLFVEPLAL